MEKKQSKKQQQIVYSFRCGITVTGDILTNAEMMREQRAALYLTSEKKEFQEAAEAVKDNIFNWLQMSEAEAAAEAEAAYGLVIARAKAAAEALVTATDGRDNLLAPVKKARAKAEAEAKNLHKLEDMLRSGMIAESIITAAAEAEAVKAAEAEAVKAAEAVRAAKDVYTATRAKAVYAEAVQAAEAVKAAEAAALVKRYIAVSSTALTSYTKAVQAAESEVAELLKEIAEAEAAAMTPAVIAEAEAAAEAVWSRYEAFEVKPHLFNNDGSLKSEKEYNKEYAEKVAGVALAYAFNRPQEQFAVCSMKDHVDGSIVPGRLLLRLNKRPELNEADKALAAAAYAKAVEAVKATEAAK